jgi:hypothetical protein
MAMLIGLLQAVVGIGSLVCFILVLIQMFQHGQTGLGIACIVLIFCVGIGALIAFVYGWMKATEWNIKNVMMAWTGCWIVGVLLGVANLSMLPR